MAEPLSPRSRSCFGQGALDQRPALAKLRGIKTRALHFYFLIIGVGLISLKSALAATLPQMHCDQFIQKTYFSICYSTQHRQAFWTSHDLTRESISGTARRSNNFKIDPEVNDPVTPDDYNGSGYDRGHLVPAADMKISAKAMSESFFMSNMSPQIPSMNRGLWSSLENAFRKWVRQLGTAWVITAPLLSNAKKKLDSGVTIPTAFYKILYIPDKKMMAAFLVPNRDTSGESFWDYATTVDEIETESGIDFYHELDDTLEDSLERCLASKSAWPIY